MRKNLKNSFWKEDFNFGIKNLQHKFTLYTSFLKNLYIFAMKNEEQIFVVPFSSPPFLLFSGPVNRI